MTDFSTLKRPLQPMPEEVRARLHAANLMEAYRSRPAYQQNDYLGWIARAKRPETREKRLKQMLAELQLGTRYMGMPYRERTPL